MDKYNSEKAKERLLKRIRQDKRNLRYRLIRKTFQYSAVGLVFFGLGYANYKTNATENGFEETVGNKNEITLQVSDGSTETISEEGSLTIRDTKGYPIGLQKGSQLVYHKSPTANDIAYNTLKVPFGKKFVLILSDETYVHLNSGTTLKYPVRFKKGKAREVFLDGEGFFEVAKDEAHPFIVNTNSLNIKVLGTQFNLSAYADDENISTVLVEGEVGFFDTNEQFDVSEYPRLVPGYMASWRKQDKKIEIEETDTNLYTGWREGKIIFDHMPFREICKKLERNYNVSISNKDKELEEIQFTASFDTETIGQVLEAFSKNYPMKYNINDNKINIEKP